MAFGVQEVIAIIIVAAVVAFAVYRRWRHRGDAGGDCSHCADKPQGAESEKPIRFYHRRR